MTADGGANWTRVPPAQLPAAATGEGSFAASGTCVETGADGRAWIVMSTPAHARLLRTNDYGRSWVLETLPITVRNLGSGASTVDSSSLGTPSWLSGFGSPGSGI